MTSEHLFKLIGSIDDEKIVDARKQRKKYVSFCRYSGVAVMAACMLLIVTATFPSQKSETNMVTTGNTFQETNSMKGQDEVIVGVTETSKSDELENENYSGAIADSVNTPESVFNSQEFVMDAIKTTENEYQIILENSDKKIYITEFTDDKYVLTDNEKVDDVPIYYSEDADISITFCINDLWYNLVFNNFTKEEAFEYTSDFIKNLQ